MSKKDRKYEKGKERLENELDIVELIHMLRTLKLMTRNKYDKRKRALLRNQRERVLSSENDESQSEVENDLDVIEDHDLPETRERDKSFEPLKDLIVTYEDEDTRLIDGVKSKTLSRQHEKVRYDDQEIAR